MTQDKAPPHIKLDEHNYIEEPLLDQLGGLGWEIIGKKRVTSVLNEKEAAGV